MNIQHGMHTHVLTKKGGGSFNEAEKRQIEKTLDVWGVNTGTDAFHLYLDCAGLSPAITASLQKIFEERYQCLLSACTQESDDVTSKILCVVQSVKLDANLSAIIIENFTDEPETQG